MHESPTSAPFCILVLQVDARAIPQQYLYHLPLACQTRLDQRRRAPWVGDWNSRHTGGARYLDRFRC